jgi:hypothetical protein
VKPCLIVLVSSENMNRAAIGLSWCLHAHELTDLDLHLAPILVKLLLELSGLLEVTLQLTAGNDEPEGNEHNDAAQHNGVDQPCQHSVEEPASVADGSLIAVAGTEVVCIPSNSGRFEQSQWISDTSTALLVHLY